MQIHFLKKMTLIEQQKSSMNYVNGQCQNNDRIVQKGDEFAGIKTIE